MQRLINLNEDRMTMTPVKIDEWKPVFKGTKFTIEQAHSTLPNGKTKIMERATRRSTIGVIAIDSKKRIFLNHEYKIALNNYIWKIPACYKRPRSLFY